jgi:hypothetical protein
MVWMGFNLGWALKAKSRLSTYGGTAKFNLFADTAIEDGR